MHIDRAHILTDKFFNGNCTTEEKQELAAWIGSQPDDEVLASVLEKHWENFNAHTAMPEAASDRILGNIFPAQEMPELPQVSVVRNWQSWPRWAAAAVLLLGVGLYFWTAGKKSDRIARSRPERAATADIAPGGNKAVLILADGSSIVLDSAGNGDLAQQGNTSIRKSAGGELVYEPGGREDAVPVFNMVATPKGGQYHIVLSDGTRVWLNAASSLRFPAAFRGAERRVEITGEVYFEVAHNARMPFIVKSGESEVKVLGTHFNVMAYPEEKAMKTTLLEGSVQVSRGKLSATLVPGQQARVSGTSGQIRVLDDVDTGQEMAWKNGFFQFEDEELEAVMRQVSRWYDVEVTYEGKVSTEHFTGRLPRNANVSKILKILSLSGVKFRIEEKGIIVTQ